MAPIDAHATAPEAPLAGVTRVRDLIFDVGLHRGEDTAFYLTMGYRVVAFEADPDNAAFCRQRFRDDIRDGRLEIVEGAIAPPGVESVTFYRSPGLSVWGTTDAEWVARRESVTEFQPVEVRTVDFAAALADHGVPQYLKIDIEGADRHCLDVVGSFAVRPRFVSIESEKFDWQALVEEFDTLEAFGYGRFAVVQQASIPGTILRTNDRTGLPIEFRFERDASGAFGPDVAPWLTRDEALNRYRRVFRDYKRYGEESRIRRFRVGRATLARLPRVTGRSYPGWYDTHAMLSE